MIFNSFKVLILVLENHDELKCLVEFLKFVKFSQIEMFDLILKNRGIQIEMFDFNFEKS